jgi:retron-type reverse transcriptase
MELKGTRSESFYRKVHSEKNLTRAWRKVYENGIKSLSRETKNQVIEFNNNAQSEIHRIYRQLLKRRFKFQPSKGIQLKRSGKEPRPIVKAPIPNRIVQRRILDILQENTKIQKLYDAPTSFGGIEGKRVKDALKLTHDSIRNGYSYFIRSDITNFFSNIPKEKVLQIIFAKITDTEFNDLLEKAVKVELENLEELGTNKSSFPDEIGVAQGCCLSPLIGNILLHDFDAQMNGRGIICLRYIDDFLILGTSEGKVKASFRSAQGLLESFGLQVYDPSVSNGKAEIGGTENGFDFLGCTVRPGLISPSRKARQRILTKVDDILNDGIKQLSNISFLVRNRISLLQILVDVNNLLIGWGNQYSFCNDRKIMKQLDGKIEDKLEDFFKRYSAIKTRLQKDNPLNNRRLLGIQLLSDIKSQSIV